MSAYYDLTDHKMHYIMGNEEWGNGSYQDVHLSERSIKQNERIAKTAFMCLCIATLLIILGIAIT